MNAKKCIVPLTPDFTQYWNQGQTISYVRKTTPSHQSSESIRKMSGDRDLFAYVTYSGKLTIVTRRKSFTFRDRMYVDVSVGKWIYCLGNSGTIYVYQHDQHDQHDHPAKLIEIPQPDERFVSIFSSQGCESIFAITEEDILYYKDEYGSGWSERLKQGDFSTRVDTVSYSWRHAAVSTYRCIHLFGDYCNTGKNRAYPSHVVVPNGDVDILRTGEYMTAYITTDRRVYIFGDTDSIRQECEQAGALVSHDTDVTNTIEINISAYYSTSDKSLVRGFDVKDIAFTEDNISFLLYNGWIHQYSWELDETTVTKTYTSAIVGTRDDILTMTHSDLK